MNQNNINDWKTVRLHYVMTFGTDLNHYVRKNFVGAKKLTSKTHDYLNFSMILWH